MNSAREPRLTDEESLVLRLLRSRKYSHVEIDMKGGIITKAYTREEIQHFPGSDLQSILSQNDFVTITLKKHNGKVTRIVREIPILFSRKE